MSKVKQTIHIRPQPGPQEAFLSSSADIVLYGGAAGGGKTFGILLEALRHAPKTKGFNAVYFRRNMTHITNPGGLWDESVKLYPSTGAKPFVGSSREWRWRNGNKVKMAHLDHETTVLDWQGSQIPLLCFDELTHFSEQQFFYMLSRNRSVCGVRPYVRATTNPDADSWVATFIAWWIDQETGYPIPERAGVIRYFARVGDAIHWGDSFEEMKAKYGRPDLPDDHEDQIRPKSFTFIPAKLSDNKELLKADPNYKANLMALSLVERERLLGGNWKIKPAPGLYFKREQVRIVTEWPSDVVKWVRRWDLAATEPSEGNPDPDWTAGVLMGLRENGRFFIGDVVRFRKNSDTVRKNVTTVAESDTDITKIGLPQDPGQAGKDQVDSYVKMLAGYPVVRIRETGDKTVRADPFAAQWQAGNVDVYQAHWNANFFTELEQFPTKKIHDDQVDAAAGAFAMLVKARTVFDAVSDD